MLIPFFTPGKHTDMSGREHEFTTEEIDRRIQLYNEQSEHEAPITIGHPRTDGPAFAWVKALRRAGDVVYAETKDDQPEFVEMVKKGLFKKVSGAFYANGLLRHIGFLGATPPAIKGLPAPAFNEEPAETIEFASGDLRPISWMADSIRGALERLRDWLIDQFDLETADNILPNWLLEGIRYDAPPIEQASSYSEAAAKPGEEAAGGSAGEGAQPAAEQPAAEQHAAAQEPGEPATAEEFGDAGAAEINRLREQLATERRQRAAIEAQGREAAERAQRAEIEAYLDSEKMRGRIAPSQRPVVIEMLMNARSQEFGEGEAKRPLSEHVKEILEAMPVQVSFAEQATGAQAAERTGEVEEARSAAAEFNERNAR